VCEGVDEQKMIDLAACDLKAGLVAWAERDGISPAEFSRRTGYSYNHAYQLLRGQAAVTTDTLGRVFVAYGMEVVRDIFVLCEKKQDGDEDVAAS